MPKPRPAVRPSTSRPAPRLVIVRVKKKPAPKKPPSIWTLTLPKGLLFRRVIAYFRRHRWGFVRDVLERRGLVEAQVRPILKAQKMPWELLLLAGVESSFRNKVVSWAGAGGLWQFIPATGKRFGLRRTAWVDERFDIAKATVAAARYLRTLQQEFRQWEWSFAAYNCGENRVRRIRRRCPKLTFWQARLQPACGIPKETRHYVARIFASLYFLRRPADRPAGSLQLATRSRRPALISRTLRQPVALTVLAARLGITVKQIHRWNPTLRSWATPPGRRFTLRLPRAYRKPLRWALRRPGVRLRAVKLRSHQHLHKVARKSNLTPGIIRAINHLPARRASGAGRWLVIPTPPKGRTWQYRHRKQLARLIHGLSRWSRHLRKLRRRGRHAARQLKRLCHRVKRGDSWWHVSRRYGIARRRLRRYNRRSAMRPGRWLRLARGASCSRLARRRRRASSWRRRWRDGSAFLLRKPRRVARRSQRSASLPRRPSRRRARKSRRKRRRCHQIQRGDTLWSVARRYGISTRTLRRLNPGQQRRSLQVGDWLRLKSRGRCG